MGKGECGVRAPLTPGTPGLFFIIHKSSYTGAQRLPASEIKSTVKTSVLPIQLKCSTPSGIGDQIKPTQIPLPIKILFCAQRLPASKIKSSALTDKRIKILGCSTPSGIGDQINQKQENKIDLVIVLNAFRHRRSNQSRICGFSPLLP